MIGMRKFAGFLMALAFAAFSLPAFAHYVTLVMTPGPAAGQLTAKVTNTSPSGPYTINSLKIPFGTNVGGVASVAVTAYSPGGTFPSVSPAGGNISIPSGISLARNQSITLTLSGVTPKSPLPSCTSTTTVWTVKASEDSNYGGYLYQLTSPTKDLTATLSPACNTVSYVGNGNDGGSVPAGAVLYASGSTVTVLANTGSLVKTGYTFAGWNTASNGGGTSYAGGATFTMGTASVTLYAQWASNPITVNFDANSGDGGAMSPQTRNYGASTNLTANAFSKTGYTFARWTTLANGGGTSYLDGAIYPFTVNVTLYAQWTIKTFNLTGTAVGSGTVTTLAPTGQFGEMPTFTVTPVIYNSISSVVGAGCTLTKTSGDGKFQSSTYQTAALTGDCTVTATFVGDGLTITKQPASVAFSLPANTSVTPSIPATLSKFDVIVDSAPGGAIVTPDTTACGNATWTPIAGSGTPTTFTFTMPEAGVPKIVSCVVNFTATYFVSKSTISMPVYEIPTVACDNGAGNNFPTSNYTGDPALDPNPDISYTNTGIGWGLRRYDNTAGGGCAPVNATLTTGFVATGPDTGKAFSNLAYDKANGQDFANFKYVIVWDYTSLAPGEWPAFRPDVAWVVIAGDPLYVPGLVCASDDMSTGSAVMPMIPDIPPYHSYVGATDPNDASKLHPYAPNQPAKMCIAQVGWTPLDASHIQYWTKIIDQSDGFVKGPQ